MPRFGFKMSSASRSVSRRHPKPIFGHSPYAAAASAHKKAVASSKIPAPTSTMTQYDSKGRLRRLRPDQLAKDVADWLASCWEAYVPGIVPRQVQPAVNSRRYVIFIREPCLMKWMIHYSPRSDSGGSPDDMGNDTDADTDIEENSEPPNKGKQPERNPRALRRVASLLKEARTARPETEGEDDDGEDDDDDEDDDEDDEDDDGEDEGEGKKTMVRRKNLNLMP